MKKPFILKNSRINTRSGRLMIIRFFIVAIFLSFYSPANVFSQRAIGVIWEAPPQTQAAQKQLRAFSDLGISYLQVDHKLDDATWNLISELDFTVYAMLPVRFPVAQTFSEADSAFQKKMTEDIIYFSSKKNVRALGLFSYGQVNNAAFKKNMSYNVKKAPYTFKGRLFYQTVKAEPSPVDSLFDFKSLAVRKGVVPQSAFIQSYIFLPDADNPRDLKPVKNFLEKTSAKDTIPVFFASSWLLKMQDKHPGFNQTLHLYATTAEPVFALPKRKPAPSRYNAVILALLAAWILFALTYRQSPVYRKSLWRYFTGHQFYVDDVMLRHIRTMAPGTSILIQHVIAGGVLCYCFFHATFSHLGAEALYSHYAVLSWFGTWKISIFVWGLVLTLVLEMIAILWLWIANPKMTSLSQILNLYPWPLQINLVLSTLALTLFLAGQSPVLIFITAAIFIMIFIAAFVVTSLNSSKYITSHRLWFLMGTAGLYIVMVVGIIIWLAASSTLLNVLKLAASLST